MPMHVGIIGVGNIGGNLARRLALAGHDVTVSFARDQAKLAAFAAEIGATVGEPSRAAAADVVVLSVPWGMIELGHTAGRHNADRMPGARYTKCFNTLTARFQAQAASRTGHARVVQWICGDDTQAKAS